MKKRILALAAASALIFPLSGTAAAAPPDITPIIVVAGFTSTRLYANPGSPDRVKVWDDAMEGVTDALLGELPGLLGGSLLWMFMGCTTVVSRAFERAVRSVMGQFAMGPDGRPAHDVGPYPGTVEDFSYAAIQRNAPEIGQLDAICRRFANTVSQDGVFVFQYDWRNSTLESVRQLREFIQEVKWFTDSSTVRLFGESYGGQVCAVYLSEYAGEGDVTKAVLEIPALGGTSLLPELIRDKNFHINVGDALGMAMAYGEMEGMPGFGFLQWLIPQFLIARLGSTLVMEGLLPNMITWGNLWDLIPPDAYEETKASMLASGGQAVWEADSDRLHREILPNIGAALQGMEEEYGVAVRIIACTGKRLAFGKERINSDGLLDVNRSTGAIVLPLGDHGLAQGGAVCGDPEHRHLSPGRDIDASAAWLPENTWFVQGTFHGTGERDPYLLGLETALMLDTGFNTVHDREEYPQFGLSRHPNEDIYAQFTMSPPGFVGEKDAALRIDNLTKTQKVKILSVCAPQGGLRFQMDQTTLDPGQALRVPVSGGTLAGSGSYMPVTVTYQLTAAGKKLSLPVIKSKTFDISVW